MYCIIPWQLALVNTNYISFGNVKGVFCWGNKPEYLLQEKR